MLYIRLRFGLLLLIFSTISHCSLNPYISQAAYTPFLKSSEDAQVQAGLKVTSDTRDKGAGYQLNSVHLAAAARITEGLITGVDLNYSKDVQAIDLLLGASNNSFELIGGCGYTNLDETDYGKLELYEAKLFRLYGQFGILNRYEYFGFGFYSKLGFVRVNQSYIENPRTVDNGGLYLQLGPVIKAGYEKTWVEAKTAINTSIGELFAPDLLVSVSLQQYF